MTIPVARGRNLEDSPMGEQRGRRRLTGQSPSTLISGPEVVHPILTLAEVAGLLRVHPTTIYRLLKSSQLPAFKVGNYWRFRLEDIDSFRFGNGETTSKEIPTKRL
jgi:excisionase family DNA binding protein